MGRRTGRSRFGTMLKNALVLVVAVVSALAAAQGLTALAASRSSPALPAPAMAVDTAVETEPEAASVAKAADGHYWAEAEVDGRWVRFLVDTGASAVALTADDARRLGLDPLALDYVRPVVTAHGQTLAAPVKLAQVSVAGARVDDVDAIVVKDGLANSLLGMSYLGRLSQFQATRTALILRP
jgi:aspartyl protease family protein